MRCIYCFKEKSTEDFTLEHILPESLGGNLCHTAFETNRVCKRCNTLCGLFVDGIFLKSWFSQNYRSENAFKYLDLENGSAIPLNYVGVYEEFSSANEVCEYWIGPCGEHIYYFHDKDEMRYSSYVKGDPIKRKRDPGYAIIFGTTENSFWIKVGLLSFREQFKGAKRYSGNYVFDNYSKQFFFHQPPPHIINLIEKLRDITDDEHKLKFNVKLDDDQRFLCKLALGFGFKLIGEEFLSSSYAKELHKALWEQDFEKRRTYKIRGTLLNSDNNPLMDIFMWEGGHVLVFNKHADSFSLSLYLFGKKEGHILISDEPRLWKNKKLLTDDKGVVYVLVPQRHICVGPLDLSSYIAHKGNTKKNPDLEELETLQIDVTKLPSLEKRHPSKNRSIH